MGVVELGSERLTLLHTEPSGKCIGNPTPTIYHIRSVVEATHTEHPWAAGAVLGGRYTEMLV